MSDTDGCCETLTDIISDWSQPSAINSKLHYDVRRKSPKSQNLSIKFWWMFTKSQN